MIPSVHACLFLLCSLDTIHYIKIPTLFQVLIKKSYGDRQKRHKMRNWKIRHLDKESSEMEVSKNVQEQDYAEFLENIEEDISYRKNVNVYFSKYGGRC